MMDKMKNSHLANQLSRIENLIPKAPKEIPKSSSVPNATGKDSFQEILSDSIGPIATTAEGIKNPQLQAKSELVSGIKFSNHAIERMQSRGISYNPERLQKLDEAVQKAAAKGSKDTLVLMDDSALIVSVKNNTVVTVMDKNNLKENVFTNIDSTVVL